MKKIILSLALALVSFYNAQAQIPNPGFENVNTDSTIQHWFSFGAFAIGLNDSILTDGPLLSYSTQSHSGNYAMELRNAYNVTQNTGFNSSVSCYGDSTFAGFQQYFSLNAKPDAFAFYYLFTQNPFIDSLSCRVIIKNSAFETIGSGEDLVWDVHMGYVLKQVSIQYISGLVDSTPVYAIIHFQNKLSPGAHVGERVLIDDVSFINYPTTTGSVGSEALSVYPNPVQEMLHINPVKSTDTYQLYTLTGAKVQEGRLQPTLSTQNLQPGVYFLHLHQAGTVQVLKFVKK